jgi:hypothetical protein
VCRESFSASVLSDKLDGLQSLGPLLPDFLKDDDDDDQLEEGDGLTLPATPLDESPSDSEVGLRSGLYLVKLVIIAGFVGKSSTE